MGTRKEKLVKLQEFANLETGQLDLDKFTYENDLYEKAVLKKSLDTRITKCGKCPGLNIKRLTESCGGWGDLNAKVFFIGQSLHKPGIVSGLPFILGCGFSLDAALRLSGLLRKDVFISNVVHCHPAGNRGSTPEERDNCLDFLGVEIEIVWPKLVVALGNDAHWAVDVFNGEKNFEKNFKILKVKHPASFMYSAPEERIGWIVKLSMEIDKVYK